MNSILKVQTFQKIININNGKKLNNGKIMNFIKLIIEKFVLKMPKIATEYKSTPDIMLLVCFAYE